MSDRFEIVYKRREDTKERRAFVEFGTESAVVLDGEDRLCLELESAAEQCSATKAAEFWGLQQNVGSRNIPVILKGVASNFSGEEFDYVCPVSDEVLCFAMLDPRFPNPRLWRKKA